MRTNSSPWSNHSYIGMILGWKVIRFKRAISTLTHWCLPFGSLCSFHFGIWIFCLSHFSKIHFLGNHSFETKKARIKTYFFLFDNFYGDWFLIGSFNSGKDLSKSATSNKFFLLIKTKVWSIFIFCHERGSMNFFQILKYICLSGPTKLGRYSWNVVIVRSSDWFEKWSMLYDAYGMQHTICRINV